MTVKTMVGVHVDDADELPRRRATPRLAPHRTRPPNMIISVRIRLPLWAGSSDGAALDTWRPRLTRSAQVSILPRAVGRSHLLGRPSVEVGRAEGHEGRGYAPPTTPPSARVTRKGDYESSTTPPIALEHLVAGSQILELLPNERGRSSHLRRSEVALLVLRVGVEHCARLPSPARQGFALDATSRMTAMPGCSGLLASPLRPRATDTRWQARRCPCCLLRPRATARRPDSLLVYPQQRGTPSRDQARCARGTPGTRREP